MKKLLLVLCAAMIAAGFLHAETTILDLKKGELGKSRADALVFYQVAMGRGLRLENGAWRLEATTRIGNWIEVDTSVTRIGEIGKDKLLPVEYSSVRCFMYAPEGQLGQANPASTKKIYLCKFKDDFGKVYYSTARENWGVNDRVKLTAAELDSLVAFMATARGKSAQFPFAEGGPAYNYRYEVRFDGQGADTKPNPARMLAQPDRLTSLPAPPTKAGFAFDGWYTAKDGQGKLVDSGTRLDSDTIVYANWLKPYAVSFNGNGFGLDPQPAPKIATVKKGIGELPLEPQHSGYLFSGWYLDKEGTKAFDPASPQSADAVVYAKWVAAFDVIFDGNGADSSWQNKTLKASAKGFTAWVPDPKRDGRVFDGWFTESEGGERILPESAVDRNLTVYAHWRDFAIGDTGPAGGIIFFVNKDPAFDWRYLEAAPADAEKQMAWGRGLGLGEGESAVPTGTSVGDGKANSAALIEVDSPDISMNAQKLSIGGYQDWFYPSQDELLLMYQNLKEKGLGGFRSTSYWSSSLTPDRNNAIAVDFYDGQAGHWMMAGSHYVRPIRAFGGAPAQMKSESAKPAPATTAQKPATAVAQPAQATSNLLLPGNVFTGTITKVMGKNKINGHLRIEILETKMDGFLLLAAYAEHQFEGQSPVSYTLYGKQEVDTNNLFFSVMGKVKSPRGFEIQGWKGSFDPTTGTFSGKGLPDDVITFEVSLTPKP
jgi:uncharacterized repeat protein (TIGR02543 family)